MKINIYEYIFKRENVPEAFYSVSKIVDAYGYGEYANIACDRIADSVLIDDKHVQIDFANFPNILIDYVGIIKCEDILSGYISIGELEKLEEFLYSTHELVIIHNSMLEFLRKMALTDLFKMIKESLTSNVEDVKTMRLRVIKIALAEIASRSIMNKIIQNAINKISILICRIKYREIYSILNDWAKEISCDLPKNGA